MQDLGTPFEPFESFAAGINATGQVIVNSFTAAGREHAFIWTAGNGLRDLGISNDISSHATGINAAGQVVGYLQIDPTVGQPAGQQHAFIWSQSSGMQDLGPVIGGSVSTANGINEQGELVGTVAFFTAEDAGHAFTWSQATGMRDLGPLSNGTSAYSTGVGINANGQVVGEGWAGGQSHAYRWSQATGMQDLGTLAGGTFSTATGINDAGDVVGRGDGTAGYHAILWSNRLSVDLLVFPFNPALPRVPVIYNRTMPLLSTPVVLAILGSATFPVADPVTHAARVQVSSVLLGKTPVAMFRGVYAAYGADVNGDGIPDLVLSFRTDQLVANGDLSTTITAPQSVVLTGTHADGRQFSGPAKISVVLAPWITPE